MRADLRSLLALALVASFAACGGSGDDDTSDPVDSVEPTEPAVAEDETEPEPAAQEPATEPTPSEPATEPTATQPVMPEPTEPPVTEPDDEPMPTMAPDETVEFDRNAAFRDEFDGELLAEAGWAWVGEDPDRWRFEDGRLVITGDNPHFMGEPVNVLTRIVPDEMELSISASLTADLQENFEAAGIMLMTDQNEYAALLLGYCDFCLPDSGGTGIFGEAMRGEDNLLGEAANIPWDPTESVTLNMNWSQGNGVAVAGYFDVNGDYQSVFRLDDAPVFTSFGLFTHNLPMDGENTADVEGRFDWFELKVYEP